MSAPNGTLAGNRAKERSL